MILSERRHWFCRAPRRSVVGSHRCIPNCLVLLRYRSTNALIIPNPEASVISALVTRIWSSAGPPRHPRFHGVVLRLSELRMKRKIARDPAGITNPADTTGAVPYIDTDSGAWEYAKMSQPNEPENVTEAKDAITQNEILEFGHAEPKTLADQSARAGMEQNYLIPSTGKEPVTGKWERISFMVFRGSLSESANSRHVRRWCCNLNLWQFAKSILPKLVLHQWNHPFRGPAHPGQLVPLGPEWNAVRRAVGGALDHRSICRLWNVEAVDLDQ